MRTKDSSRVSIRLRFSLDARIGPGKIALLEGVDRTGSIAAAGRELGMSYRRAWLLIDSMAGMFDEPVIVTASGGTHGGGSRLTALGHDLVAAFRAAEHDAQLAVETRFHALLPRIRLEARAPGGEVSLGHDNGDGDNGGGEHDGDNGGAKHDADNAGGER
ncbi:MAG: LysR family transcriptional regulator [Burkholderiaceae bacterium]|nr:LysR family transcriptional regulator [Burkholderiaceae bacterium]